MQAIIKLPAALHDDDLWSSFLGSVAAEFQEDLESSENPYIADADLPQYEAGRLLLSPIGDANCELAHLVLSEAENCWPTTAEERAFVRALRKLGEKLADLGYSPRGWNFPELV